MVNTGLGATTVYTGARDAVVNIRGLFNNIKLPSSSQCLTINGFASDPLGVVDLLDGIGGYGSLGSARGALHGGGPSGSIQNLYAGSYADFANTAPGQLYPGNFAMS